MEAPSPRLQPLLHAVQELTQNPARAIMDGMCDAARILFSAWTVFLVAEVLQLEECRTQRASPDTVDRAEP